MELNQPCQANLKLLPSCWWWILSTPIATLRLQMEVARPFYEMFMIVKLFSTSLKTTVAMTSYWILGIVYKEAKGTSWFILQPISGNSALVSWNHFQCQVDLLFFNETRLSRTWTAWLACHWVVVVGVSQKRSGAARNPRLAGVPCRAEGCCNLLGALFRQSPEADNKK